MSDFTEDEQAAIAALARVDDAVREYADLVAKASGDEQGTVTGSVLMWESARMDESGDIVYRIAYAFPSPLSLSSAMGLTTLGAAQIELELGDPGADD